MKVISIHEQLILACRRVINLQNQDPLSKTRGCFDRRFWAWKLCDYPEATFQRLILPLCWYVGEEKDPPLRQKAQLAIRLGLEYALKIQHSDGSFDQAYPHEHSYGATAFLLHPLLQAYQSISSTLNQSEKQSTTEHLYRSAEYLVSHKEQHSFIANHLAGSALALMEAGMVFKDTRFSQSAQELVNLILSKQSPEGWYWEYDGADPGYQTLCVHYLAQIYRLNQEKTLLTSLQRSLDFLTYFAHPDGSFGGEYGSRRTAIYYPGGIALLGNDIPEVANLNVFMLQSIEEGRTVGVNEIDVGNLAPLLSSTILAVQTKNTVPLRAKPLPCQLDQINRDFSMAGLSIRGNSHYYTVIGISNGGICKVFDKKNDQLIYDDCGVILQMKNGAILTSQHTQLNNATVQIDEHNISFSVPLGVFSSMEQAPGKFLLLRIANLTLMRIPFLNELVKKMLVKVLVKPSQARKMVRSLRIAFHDLSIQLDESITGRDLKSIQSISRASGFTAIHMASARYPLTTSGISSQKDMAFEETDDVLFRHEEIRFSGVDKP